MVDIYDASDSVRICAVLRAAKYVPSFSVRKLVQDNIERVHRAGLELDAEGIY